MPKRALVAAADIAVLAVAPTALGFRRAERPLRAAPRSARITASAIKSPTTEPLAGGKRGGVLTALNEGDFENLDPGISYYSLDFQIVYATERPLYSNKPNSKEPSPDLAAAPPQISADSKTVTVRLKRGVRFSPPVNREVTSADVAYAIERGANPNVANPYLLAYFGSIEGMDRATGGPARGIVTPNRHEIVFKLTAPDGQIVADALQLPLSAPVPKSYAERYDRHRPSTYAAHEVATGPYMLKNDAAGRVLGVGYRRGRDVTLVRNPNWRRRTDFRPAYLNEIHIQIGGVNPLIERSRRPRGLLLLVQLSSLGGLHRHARIHDKHSCRVLADLGLTPRTPALDRYSSSPTALRASAWLKNGRHCVILPARTLAT